MNKIITIFKIPELAQKIGARHFSFQTNRALAVPRITPGENDRLGAEEIGNSPGIDISHRQAIPIDRDICEQRVAHALVKSFRGG